jgi:hypothetical protein
MTTKLQQGFGFGEISPRLQGQVDSRVYLEGCPTFENMTVSRHGAALRRPGTRFASFTSPSNLVPARYIPFTIKKHGRFVIELTNLLGQVFDVDSEGYLLDGGAARISFVTPFTTADLPDIADTQDRKSLFLVHPLREPQVVTRDFDGDDFQMNPVASRAGLPVPIWDRRVHTFNLTREGTTITSDEKYFLPDDAQDIWRLQNGYFRVLASGNPISTSVTADIFGAEPPDMQGSQDWAGPFQKQAEQTGRTIRAEETLAVGETGAFTITVGGNILTKEVAEIWMIDSIANPNTLWLNIVERTSPTVFQARVIEGSTVATTLYPGIFPYQVADRTLDDNFLLQIAESAGTDIRVACNLELFTSDMIGATLQINRGFCTIKSITDAFQAKVDWDLVAKNRKPTNLWGQGYSAETGFPRAVGIHQDRLFLGGCEQFPNTLIGSRTGQHEIFGGGGLPADALRLFMSGDKANLITWIKTAGVLLVGTEDGEFSLKGNPLSIIEGASDLQSGHGGRAITPVQAGTDILFATRAGQGMREMAFRFERDKYLAPDLTDHADHLFDYHAGKEIVDLDYLKEPESVVFALRADSLLRAMTYRRENNVVAWSPWSIPTNSMAVINTGTIDAMWINAKRTIDEDVVYYAEILDYDAVFDSQVTVTSPGSTTFTMPSGHLFDEVVGVIADGVYLGLFTLTGNSLDLSAALTSPPTTVIIGLEFTHDIEPQFLYVSEPGGGSQAGKSARKTSLNMLMNASVGGAVDGGGDALDIQTPLRLPTPSVPPVGDDVPVPFSGWVTIDGLGIDDRNPSLHITGHAPFAWELIALTIEESYGGN